MKERPILFSAPMVLALLAGTKTQTRRIVKPQPGDVGERTAFGGAMILDTTTLRAKFSPYGAARDRLWVKETWGFRGRGVNNQAPTVTDVSIEYRADMLKRSIIRPASGIEDQLPKQHCLPKFKRMGVKHPTEEHYGECLTAYWRAWRPSLFMRRWMSRITLDLVAVRVERLHEISEADAEAEGVRSIVHEGWSAWDPALQGYPEWSVEPTAKMIAERKLENVRHHKPRVIITAVEQYRRLWESINGVGSWALNPWVWVVTFKTMPA